MFAHLKAGRLDQVHPDLRATVLGTAVRHGGKDEYDAVKAMYRAHTSSEQRNKCLQAMGAAATPALVKDYLEWGAGIPRLGG